MSDYAFAYGQTPHSELRLTVIKCRADGGLAGWASRAIMILTLHNLDRHISSVMRRICINAGGRRAAKLRSAPGLGSRLECWPICKGLFGVWSSRRAWSLCGCFCCVFMKSFMKRETGRLSHLSSYAFASITVDLVVWKRLH